MWEPSAGFTLFERWISISPEEDVLAGMICVAEATKSLVRFIMFGKNYLLLRSFVRFCTKSIIAFCSAGDFVS